MGYHHHIWKGTCGACKKTSAWVLRGPGKIPRSWKCQCGSTNYFRALPDWPDLPGSLYIGWDNKRLLKLYPVPPERSDEQWAQPYSVRSFVHQASRSLHGCSYFCQERGRVFAETYSLTCAPTLRTRTYTPLPGTATSLLDGPLGSRLVPFGNTLKALCQNDTEGNFLHAYLRYVKDRQFPMLIPQVRVGIAERRRPDFVSFVPLQYWSFKRVAIELDGAHGEEQRQSDGARDKYLEEQSYEVVSLRPNAKGYLEEVKALVERFEIWMNLAETDVWEAAIEVQVTRTENSNDIPF